MFSHLEEYVENSELNFEVGEKNAVTIGKFYHKHGRPGPVLRCSKWLIFRGVQVTILECLLWINALEFTLSLTGFLVPNLVFLFLFAEYMT